MERGAHISLKPCELIADHHMDEGSSRDHKGHSYDNHIDDDRER